jgi:glycosyltransferase involved in cell wall biosynthesis
MLRAIFSKPYSLLFIVGDNANWAIDVEAKALEGIARKLNIPAQRIQRARLNLPQPVHYTSQFSLNEPSIYRSKHRLSVDYYHGKPEQGENFRKCFESLKNNHTKLSRVRVSTHEMEELIKTSGIDPAKIMRIPIGIDTDLFPPQTSEKKRLMRAKLGIPETATVIGSFQKDGVGWGKGNEPKLIKGPDIFLKIIERLKDEVPGLWVLLSGPARGFIKNGLNTLGIPYRHQYLDEYKELSGFYDALDLYLITSREEGGPKACLESMSKMVPLITTTVGQCRDLVESGKNAMMAPIDNVEELHALALKVLRDPGLRQALASNGLITAQENSYEAQLPLWKKYFENLVDG